MLANWHQHVRDSAAAGYVTDAERRGDSIVFVQPDHPVDLGNPAEWWRIVKGGIRFAGLAAT